MTPEDVKTILEENKVVLFMKGTKMFPRCGYSARAMAVINQFDIPFAAVDVLADPTVRPALVAHSKWPTTPQMFIDGQLIGGSDICLELYHKGEIQKLLEPHFPGVTDKGAAARASAEGAAENA